MSALEFDRQLKPGSGKRFFSPYSISFALDLLRACDASRRHQGEIARRVADIYMFALSRLDACCAWAD